MAWVGVVDNAGVSYELNLDHIIRVAWVGAGGVRIQLTGNERIEVDSPVEVQKVRDAIELVNSGHGR
jgi:hypothetical protein